MKTIDELQAEIAGLKAILQKKDQEIETLEKVKKEKSEQIAKLKKLNDWYMEQLKLKAREKFGKSSEKAIDGQLSLFDVRKHLLSPVLKKEDKTWRKFSGIIESGLFDNGSRVHLVCTLTALIDEVNKGVKESDIYEKFFNYEMIKDPYDIEHIEARNNFKDDKDNVDEFNGIGNLMVLERSINRSIKDKPVGCKIKRYEESKYAAVKAVRQEILDKHKDKWDIECVVKRRKEEKEKIESFMDGK